MCLSDSDSSSGVTHTQRGVKSKISVGMLKLLTIIIIIMPRWAEPRGIQYTAKRRHIRIGAITYRTRYTLCIVNDRLQL